MADTGWIVATGEGHQLIDGGTGHFVQDILVMVESATSARIRTLGTDEPKRMQFAGSVGWALNITDRHGASILTETYEGHIRFDATDLCPPKLDNDNRLFSDTIWWKLPPGLTAAIIGAWE